MDHDSDRTTEYVTNFKGITAKPRQSLRPPERALVRDAPMSNETTSRLDYVPHVVTPPYSRPPTVFKPPDGSMESESVYKREFTPRKLEPAKPILPQQNQVRYTDRFAIKSSYAVDYVQRSSSPRESFAEKRVFVPPTETFGGLSTMQTDFKQKPFEPVQNFKPSQKPNLSRDPFNAGTLYKDDFKTFPIPERFVRPRVVYKQPSEKFGGISTFTTDFPGHVNVNPVSSLRPSNNPNVSNAPFQDGTESRQSYRKWEIPPRFTRQAVAYEPPKTSMATTTVFAEEFVDFSNSYEPSQSCRPPLKPIKHDIPFDFKSVQHIDYQRWDVSNPRQPILQGKKYEPPTEKFQGTSTATTDFRGVYAPPAKSTKPPLQPYSRGTKMEGETLYRENYSREASKPCPAVTLSASGEDKEYIFSHDDSKTGHQFYTHLPEVKA